MRDIPTNNSYAPSLHTILAVSQAIPLRKGNARLLKSPFIAISEATTFYCANSSYFQLKYATVHPGETEIFLDEDEMAVSEENEERIF